MPIQWGVEEQLRLSLVKDFLLLEYILLKACSCLV